MNSQNESAFRLMNCIITGCVGVVAFYGWVLAFPANWAGLPFWLLTLAFLFVAVPCCSSMVVGLFMTLSRCECSIPNRPRRR